MKEANVLQKLGWIRVRHYGYEVMVKARKGGHGRGSPKLTP